MPNYSLPRQPRLGDERQIFDASRLEPGAQIGVYQILRGTSRGQRLLQAASVLGGLGTIPKGSSQWAATRAAWNHRGPEGALPQFRGTVQAHDEQHVWLTMTGELVDHRHRLDYLGTDVADLPEIAPIESRKTLTEIGLVAISAASLSEILDGSIWDIGGYHPAATVLTAPATPEG